MTSLKTSTLLGPPTGAIFSATPGCLSGILSMAGSIQIGIYRGVAYHYSGTLIIGPFLGRAKCGQISKVVTLSRRSGHILWESSLEKAELKSGLNSKVVS